MKDNYLNFLKSKTKSTIFLTIIYTIGHFIIAAICAFLLTGADVLSALTDATVEPIVNGIWFGLIFHYFGNKAKNH